MASSVQNTLMDLGGGPATRTPAVNVHAAVFIDGCVHSCRSIRWREWHMGNGLGVLFVKQENLFRFSSHYLYDTRTHKSKAVYYIFFPCSGLQNICSSLTPYIIFSRLSLQQIQMVSDSVCEILVIC